jgi:selenocysteine lyase/cysteine desulfurase
LENIRTRIRELTDYLIDGLKNLGVKIVSPVDSQDERSAIVSFTLEDINEDCVKRLTEESILVSQRAGLIRVAVNIFNDYEDIDKLLTVLQSIA